MKRTFLAVGRVRCIAPIMTPFLSPDLLPLAHNPFFLNFFQKSLYSIELFGNVWYNINDN